ncbi:MAG: hypothetical protein ACI8W8_003347 [Rhodothermales bacterium]|jgi:hypothetical protein
MPSPRTFKHTPKEDRDAAQRKKRSARRKSQVSTPAAAPAKKSPQKRTAGTTKTAINSIRRAPARTAATKKPTGQTGILPWALGGVGVLALILILAIAAGDDSGPPASSKGGLRNQGGGSKADRMANQRYNDLDGKTIKEWMSEQDETDMARERRERLQDHKKGK